MAESESAANTTGNGGGDWVERVSSRSESGERRAVGVLESVCCTGWLSSAGQANLTALGFDDRMAMYTATRAAPLGAVAPPVVAAVFYNFRPEVIERSARIAWDTATIPQILEAERKAADAELTTVAAQMPAADVKELAALTSEAARQAATFVNGRPIAAGVAAMPWPDEPHLAVWHAHHLLREHRGDSHNACLQQAGLSGLDALVIDCARTGFAPANMQMGRFWPAGLWDQATQSLHDRGWVTADGQLTDWGRESRFAIEDQTDALAAPAFASIGADGVARIIELGTVFGGLAAPLALTKPRTRLSVDGK